MNTPDWLTTGRARGLALSLALTGLSLLPAFAATRHVVLVPNTVIPVRLDTPLTSRTAHVGDRVTVTVRPGIDDASLPAGTRFVGIVRDAQPASDRKPGTLDIDFRRMYTPGGQNRTFSGSIISLDSKSIRRSESGQLTAVGDKNKDRLKFIGIGAGAGLVIGSLTKNNTVTSTLLGAAAGYLYNEYANKQRATDVDLKAGTEFGIKADRSFAFETNKSEPPRPQEEPDETPPVDTP